MSPKSVCTQNTFAIFSYKSGNNHKVWGFRTKCKKKDFRCCSASRSRWGRGTTDQGRFDRRSVPLDSHVKTVEINMFTACVMVRLVSASVCCLAGSWWELGAPGQSHWRLKELAFPALEDFSSIHLAPWLFVCLTLSWFAWCYVQHHSYFHPSIQPFSSWHTKDADCQTSQSIIVFHIIFWINELAWLGFSDVSRPSAVTPFLYNTWILFSQVLVQFCSLKWSRCSLCAEQSDN